MVIHNNAHEKTLAARVLAVMSLQPLLILIACNSLLFADLEATLHVLMLLVHVLLIL